MLPSIKPLSRLWPYGLAVALVAVATVLTLLLAQFVDRAIFILFHAAIAIVTWRGGLRAGFLAVALSALSSLYFLLPPPLSLEVALPELVQISAFVLVALLIAWLVGSRMEAEAKAEARAHQAEEAQRLLHTLLKHVPEGITIAEGPPDFPITVNSAMAAELLARPPERLIGMPVGQHIEAYGLFLADGETRPTLEQLPLYRATRFGEAIKNEEWVIARPDGRRLTVLVDVNPIRAEDGQIIGAVNCWRDITERKQLAAERQAAYTQLEAEQRRTQELHAEAERVRQRLERILAGIKDDFVMYDRDWRYVYVNERAAQTLGYSKEQLIGQRIWDMFPDAVGNFFYQKVHQAVAEEREITFEFYYEPFDRWFENRTYPISDGLLLFSADITERKQVEERLRQSEARMRLAIEANRMVAWDWNPLTDRVTTSDNFADIYGLPALASAAEGFALIWPEDFPAHQEKVDRITREGGEYHSEFRISRPADGQIVWIEERASALTDAEGRVTRLVGVAMDVTRRIETQQEARRLAFILEATPDFVAIAKTDGQVVFMNRAGRQMVGLAPDADLSRISQADLCPPWVFERTQQEWLPTALQEGAVSGEGALLSADGNEVPVSFVMLVHRNAAGEPEYLSTVARDITERKRWEEEREQLLQHLAAEYERLEIILQQTPAGIVIAAAPSGETLLVNEHAKQLTGFDFEKSVAIERYQEIQNFQGFHPDGRPYQAEEWPLARAVRRGEPVINEEIELRRADGSRVIIQANASPIYNAAGQIVAGVTAFVDITAQKQAEQALRESEERFRALANAIPSIVWTAAPDGTITYANEKWFNFVGITPEENARSWPEIVLHPDDYERCMQAWTEALATGPAVYEIEVRNRRYDGEYRWFLTRAVPTRDAAGRVTAWYGVTTDIHDRKQAEEAAHQARRAAEETTQRIASLQAVTARLSQAVTPAEIIPIIFNDGLATIGAAGSLVALLTPERDTFEIVNSIGYPAGATASWQRFPLKAGLPMADVIQSGQPLFLGSREAVAALYADVLATGKSDHQAWAVLPLVGEAGAIGAISISFVEARAFSPEEREFIETLTRLCAQALERSRLYEIEQQARHEAEANQQRLALLAEMRERNRLAQELHDTVAQALGYLNLKIGITSAALNSDQIGTTKANLQELKQVINETYTDVREEIFNLRAQTLSDLSFMELLTRYIDKYRRFYNLDIQLSQEAEASLFEFPAQVTSQVVRTIQEALINIRKHAQVNTALIRLGQEKEQPCISIEDQGRGFDLAEAKGKTSSFGLQIMRERIESVGGSLEIESAPGQGARVILRFRPEARETGPS